MDRITITIRPAPSDEALLSVNDAMQQVIDYIRVFDAAEQFSASPRESFIWRLERANTNSPFTVVAIADAKNPSVDVSAHVKRIKREVSEGLRSLIQRGVAPAWMDEKTTLLVRGAFQRNTNGIGETDIDFENDADEIKVDVDSAVAGLQAIEAINVLSSAADLIEREAFGEIEGVMVAAGRYRNKPAIQIRSEYYGFIWCALSDRLIERFGSEHTMRDVWDGKPLGVEGVLHYAKGGRLGFISAVDIREIADAPRIDLESVLDPNFTAGMDPHEYLDKLHEGELG